MKYLKFKGSSFQVGYEIGKSFSQAIKYRIESFHVGRLLPERKDDLVKIHEKAERTYPQYTKELEGMAKGSDTDYWLILLLNCFELLNTNRCSSLAISKPGAKILAHNEDADAFERKEDFAIIEVSLPDISFHTFYYPGELCGSSFSWNSRGIIFTVNNLRFPQPDYMSIPKVFTARALLEGSSLENAIDILRNNICAGGYHYFISDKRKIISAEHVHDDVSAVEIHDTNVHTNHCLHGKFKNASLKLDNSEIRYRRLQTLIKGDTKLPEIFFDRQNGDFAIYATVGETKTLATFVADFLAGRIMVYNDDSGKDVIEFKI